MCSPQYTYSPATAHRRVNSQRCHAALSSLKLTPACIAAVVPAFGNQSVALEKRNPHMSLCDLPADMGPSVAGQGYHLVRTNFRWIAVTSLPAGRQPDHRTEPKGQTQVHPIASLQGGTVQAQYSMMCDESLFPQELPQDRVRLTATVCTGLVGSIVPRTCHRIGAELSMQNHA
jgi:hypothetical protein